VRSAHERIAKIVRATAKPGNEHLDVVPKDAQKVARRDAEKVVPKDAEKVVPKDAEKHVRKDAKEDARQVVPGRIETWGQVADLLPRDAAPKPAILRIAALRRAGVNGGAMPKVVDPKHAVPKHVARRIEARSAVGRWLDRRGDSDRLAWALVDLAGVAQAGDADHAALVRRRWHGKQVEVAALDHQPVVAARAIAAQPIVRGLREGRTESISGSTS
jgi:hypothetical protein